MNVYLNDTEVFLDGDQLPAFTLSLSDLLDPSSIRGTRSTTIRILNTPASRAILGSEAMMWNGADTRPTIKFKEGGATVYESDVVVMRADRNVYECACVGGNASWFEWAKKTKMNELDLGTSERITASVIVSTWTNAPGYMYFPLIDFGSLEDRAIAYEVPADVIRPGIGIKASLSKGFRDEDWHFKPMGLFDDHLTKMVLHNGGRNAKSIDDGNGANTIAAHMTVDPSTPYIFKRYGGANPDPVDLSDLSITLGSALMNATSDSYRVDRDVNMHTSFVSLKIGIPPSYIGYRFRIALWDRTDGRELAGVWTRAIDGSDASPFEFTGALPTAFVLEGHDVHFAVMLDDDYGSASYTGTLTSGPPNQINYDPEAPYIYDSKLIIATAAPAMAVIDVLKGLNDWRGLVFNTNIVERLIEVWYDDEFFRPLTADDQRDMRGRIDHTIAPAKLSQQLPGRLLYRFKEDKSDRDVARLTRLIGPIGYANANVEIGGVLDDKTITLPFAATAMGAILDDLLMVPVIRKVDGDYQVDSFEIDTRILIADGTENENWTLQADPYLGTAATALSYYPKCYFLWPGANNVPMAFDEAIHTAKGYLPSTTPGTIRTSALQRIQRMAGSKVFEAMAEWNDHELVDLDFGQATIVHDGHSEGQYYVQKIDGYTPGKSRFVKTQFVQIPQVAMPALPVFDADAPCEGGLIVSGAGNVAANGVYCYYGGDGLYNRTGGVPFDDMINFNPGIPSYDIYVGGVAKYRSYTTENGPYFALNPGDEPAPSVTDV